MSQTPSVGRIVLYTLTAQDADTINNTHSMKRNTAREGDVYPAIVVRVWTAPMVQLQVFYDGEGTYWAPSRTEGDRPGTWQWPPRV